MRAVPTELPVVLAEPPLSTEEPSVLTAVPVETSAEDHLGQVLVLVALHLLEGLPVRSLAATAALAARLAHRYRVPVVVAVAEQEDRTETARPEVRVELTTRLPTLAEMVTPVPEALVVLLRSAYQRATTAETEQSSLLPG